MPPKNKVQLCIGGDYIKKQNNMESSSNYLFNMVQKMLTGHNHILNSIKINSSEYSVSLC